MKAGPVLWRVLRHWTWADEAKTTFDRELANGWDYDDDPLSDHPFGAYYHWCALLCAFGAAALDHGLLSPLQLEPIRQDIEASLAGVRMTSAHSSDCSPIRGSGRRCRCRSRCK